MSLPQPDPSNPALPAPLFADVDAVRGDHLRANNQLIWEDLQYLDDGENINDAAAATPVDADKTGFWQIAGTTLKYVTFANLFLWVVTKIYALASKTTPADADQLLITDSAAGNVGKSLTWANLKATLLAYFDTQYKEQIAIIENQQTSGTGGGAISGANTWVKSPLNTIVTDPDSIITSLASDVITLPAGTYGFEWALIFYQMMCTQSRMRNTSDSISYLGQSSIGSLTANIPSLGKSPKFTISGSKTFELQAISSGTRSANDFGRGAMQGTEIYSRLIITKYG